MAAITQRLEDDVRNVSDRRAFVKRASLLVAGAYASPWLRVAVADGGNVVATTASGKVRGTLLAGININIFKGIPYGSTTAGKNRFMPPAKPTPWTETRDVLAY